MYMSTTQIEDGYLMLVRLNLKRLALLIFGSLICLVTTSIAQASPNIIVTTNKPIYEIGDSSTVYTISGAQPNSPIYWSSWKDGVSTGETLAFYGHYTDGNGKVTLATNTAWAASQRGFWKKQATIGAKSSYITFYVIPKLTVNASMYTVGSQPFYSVTGAPPYSPIYWSSWINGVSTGETDTFYGHYTDANGNFSSYGGQWLSSHLGFWKKQVKIGTHVSATEFVVNSSNLNAHATKFTPRSQAFLTLTGAYANYPIYWTTYLNGSIVLNNYFRGGYTNSSGGWTGVTSPFLPSEVGHWVLNLSVGGITYSTSFYVGPTSLNTFTQIAGSYSWNPSNNGAATRASVDAKRMGDLGARVHRLLFNISSDSPCAGDSTLKNIAQSADVKKALSDPRISTYVLTIGGDAKSCHTNGTKYWNPILFNPALSPVPNYSDTIKNDIMNLTTYLYQTYKGTGKKFIISHWESDNSIRCAYYDRVPGASGFVYGYHYNIGNIRSYCDGKTDSYYDVPVIFNIRKYDDSDYADSDEQYDGYRRFLEVYQQGVSLGKDAATAQMCGGVEVYHAPEGAAVNLLYSIGHKNIFRDVIPYIDYDYISYSSYETTNYDEIVNTDAAVAARIQTDLNTISSIAAPSGGYFKNIIIGEFAQPFTSDSTTINNRYANVLNTSINWGVAYMFNWPLYREESSGGNEGIYTNAGSITPLGVYYRNRFGQYYF